MGEKATLDTLQSRIYKTEHGHRRFEREDPRGSTINYARYYHQCFTIISVRS